MAKQKITRKLAAILAADVVGYSRLVGVDEEGTIARLKALHEELIDPGIAQHNGRIVKTTGDGILAEFPSVVDAVRNAVAMQRALAEREADVPEDHRILFRIGVNLGDIVIDGDDILGDGVNVAARLEGLAKPGGICISGDVFRQVDGKLDLGFEDLGEQQVKNIEKPVRAYFVLLESEAAGTVVSKRLSKPKAWRLGVVVAAAAAVIAVAVTAVWWRPWIERVEPASIGRMAFALPDKPSIAVLPFDNLTGDLKQDYLSDGITENIITTLSNVPRLFVIARNSTFTYKGKPVKVQQVAEELGVRYVLEGSLQRSGEKLRITAQLIDAVSGYHLWSKRYDRDLRDIFALQDDITGHVIAALEVELTEGEQARLKRAQTSNVEAYDIYLRGRERYLQFTNEDNEAARQHFERALALAPELAAAWAGLGWTRVMAVQFGWTKAREESLTAAEVAALKALDLDDTYANPYALLAFIALQNGEHDQAIDHCDRSMALNPNEASTTATCASVLTFAGEPQKALDLIRAAMRKSPYYPDWYLDVLGRAYRLNGEFVEAVTTWQTLRKRKPIWTGPLIMLAATLADADDEKAAQGMVASLLEKKPDMSVQEVGRSNWYTGLYRDRATAQSLLAALRKAGLPEHPPLKLPDKPSIAVLPFANMSGDPEQEYFADGMAEDIITDLSKISGLFVIARNSSFAYKGKQADVRAIARELGVKYILEGSVRRAGQQVRINAQLVDATTGGHLWAERYDGGAADIFKLQDRVTQQIVASLSVTLSAGERALAEQMETSVPEAYDAFLTGWRHFRLRTVEDYRTAIVWLEKAVALDPGYGRAWATLASLYLEAFQRAWVGELGIDYARLPDLLDKAMKRPTPLAYQVEAEILMQEKRFDEAEAMLDKASALDPNDPDTYVLRSTLVAIQGDTDTAIALMKTAMRLDPHYPAFNLFRLGALHLRAGDIAKAIAFLERARARNPGDWVSLVYLTAAYAEADRLDDAEQTAKALVERRKELGFLVTLVESFDNWYTHSGTFGERVRQGLGKAGLRDTVRAEDLKLSPENRLSEAELRADLKSSHRRKGRVPSGVWTRDMDPAGNGVHYWNGSQTATSTSEIRGDMQHTKRSNGSEQSCAFYRNPKGAKENLDEFIAVCSNGVFPYARLPLPRAAQ